MTTSKGKFKRIFEALSLANIGILDLFLPALLAALASVAEGASLALLIPALQGIISRDVSFVLDLPGFRQLGNFLGITDGNDPLVIIMVVAAAFTSALARTAFQYGSSVLTTAQIKRFANNLRSLIFDRLLSFGKLFFDRSNSGQVQEILTSYVTYISHSLSTLQGGLYAVLTLGVYIAILCSISFKLTFAAFLVFPLLFISVRSLITKIIGSSYDYVEAYNQLAKQIANSLASIPLVKAYSTEKTEGTRFLKLSTDVSEMEYQIERRGLLVSPLQETVLLVFLFILVSIISVVVINDPTLNLASFAVYLLVLKRAASLFGVVNSMRSALAGISGPLEEVLALFNDEDKFFVPCGSTEFETLEDKIEFNSLSFAYSKDLNVLDKVSFSIARGTSVALVGASGSGKSTIINLLMRFYDCNPKELLVDGTDIREFDTTSWLNKIALVSQDTFLFNATLGENLEYGLRRSIPEDELWSVLERARLAEFVQNLPEGLETQIGDRGVKLSGGERQRVAIARAMLKKTEILLLDEATSALDSVTEKLVQEALEELMLGRTTLVIAHRLSTIRNADEVVVLEDGKVVERGTPGNLRERGGIFAEYWDQQSF